MEELNGKVAVITGGASGIGLATARAFAAEGASIVIADIEAAALAEAEASLAASGPVLAVSCDVSDPAQVDALRDAAVERFGTVHIVHNNAGVSTGGAVWTHTPEDWDWVLGVNLMGVVHGVRLFTPMMLDAARQDPAWRGHIVNTASMAGLLTPPNMGIYNVSKHAVVSLTETLYQDLALVTDQVGASVLCPYFVPTGIGRSERNRPDAPAAPPTRSQLIGQAMNDKAVGSGKVTAAEVAQIVFDGIAANRFYLFSHPQALGNVQSRMESIVAVRNPPDPFLERPDIGQRLREQLRAEPGAAG